MDLPPPLDLQNEYKFFEWWQIAITNFLLRYFVELISSPLLLWPIGNRFKTRVDTGTTGKCRVCIYVPHATAGLQKERAACRGVLVHLHAGGWTICRPETETPLCRFLCQELGVVVVAPDYRKAPRYPYPHALEQCYSILSWIATGGLSEVLEQHHFTKDINPKLIALSGGSAGSNLAASLTLLSINRPLPNGASVAGIGLLYPALNLAVPYEEKLARVDPNRVLPPWMSKMCLKGYLPPPRDVRDPYVSPALAPRDVLAKFPPTVILTAAYDYLAHEAEEFAATLDALGVQVEHKRFLDVGHAFDGMPARNKKQRKLNKGAREEAWGMMANVFRQVLKEKGDEMEPTGREFRNRSTNIPCSATGEPLN